MIRVGREVSSDELNELLWNDAPPARAADIVHRHIGTLRRLLEPELPFREQGRWLHRTDRGYRLEAKPEDLDLLEFRQLAEEGRAAAEDGDHAVALRQRMAALGLWRGRCGEDLDLPVALAAEFRAVEVERVTMVCAAADDVLIRGGARDLLPLVRQAAEQDSLDEAIQARLILLLGATGQQAAALSVYQTVRRRLAEELGVDPGAELRRAFERVLRQEVVVAGPETPAAPSVIPEQLPAASRHFYGRHTEQSWLSGLVALAGSSETATVIGVVDGLPGVGKTSLVVHWARQVADRFPDGQMFVNLQGFDLNDSVVKSNQALVFLLAGLGVSHAQIPSDAAASAALFRTMTAGRRMLIVLDNARDEEQVRPLLPASPGSLVVITSRNRLSGLITQEGAQSLSLSVPSRYEARAAMRARLGVERDGDDATVDEIIERCGRLPLAMAVVAARAASYPDWSLNEIAEELRAAAPLDFLEGDEPRTDVRNVFFWSYRMLSERAARLFRLLSVHPGVDFGLSGAASIAGVAPHVVRQLLRELTRTRLINEIRPGRYAFHDLIKAYAAELGMATDLPEERAAALSRLLDHLWQTSFTAGSLLEPAAPLTAPPAPLDGVSTPPMSDMRSAMGWFTTELSVLEAALAVGAEAGFRAWQPAEALVPYYQRRGMTKQWRSSSTRALQAAVAAGDLEGQAVMHRILAGAEVYGSHDDAVRRDASARAHLALALELFDRVGRPLDKAFAYYNLGAVHLAADRHAEAFRAFQRAYALFEPAGHRRGMALALLGRGWGHWKHGDPDAGLEDLARCQALALEAGDLDTAGACATWTAEVYSAMGSFGQAVEWLRRAVGHYAQVDSPMPEAYAVKGLGDALSAAGRPEQARAAWRVARDRFAALGKSGTVAKLNAKLSEETA